MHIIPQLIVYSITSASGSLTQPASEPTFLGSSSYLEASPDSREAWNRSWATPSALDRFDSGRESGMYFQVGAGLLTTSSSDGPGEEIDFDEGYAIPFAIGRRFRNDPSSNIGWDLELEGYWSDQDTDDPDGPINAVRDVTIFGGLLNGVLDAAVSERFSLYGGAGLGLAFMDVGTQSDAFNDFDDEDGPFLTWQLKAGLRLYAKEDLSWNLGYRFVNIDDAEIDDNLGGASFDLETEQHVIELGVRFSF